VSEGYLETGPKVFVPGTFDKIPAYNRRTHEHLWIMTGCWRINPETLLVDAEPWHLDTENMVALAGPGCFYCEREYTPEVAARRCGGMA
jgi:hypothetical protein